MNDQILFGLAYAFSKLFCASTSFTFWFCARTPNLVLFYWLQPNVHSYQTVANKKKQTPKPPPIFNHGAYLALAALPALFTTTGFRSTLY